MKYSKVFSLGFILSFILLILTVCSGCDKVNGKIDFSKIQENPKINPITEEPPLRVAFASVISPSDTRQSYQIIIKELSKKLNRPVVLIQKKTYEELNVLLANGEADIAFLSTGAYLSYKGAYPIELLAMIQTKGTLFYDTYLIAAKDSGIEDFDDLYQKTFAFTDPSSFSGKLVVDDALIKQGKNIDDYFSHYMYTYNHDKSILAVANHLADAASIDSQVYDYMAETNPDLIKQVKIIDKLEKAPSGPIVIRKDIPEEEKKKIQEVLFHIHEEPEVQSALEKVMIDKFVIPDAQLYEKIKLKYNIK